MRTTIRLDDMLLADAKMLAHQRGQTLTAIIEEALHLILSQRDKVKSAPPVKLITFKGDGLQPGVDLNDSAALLELMESTGDLT